MVIVNDEYDDHDDSDKKFDLISILFKFLLKNLSTNSKLHSTTVTTSAIFETFHCFTFCDNEVFSVIIVSENSVEYLRSVKLSLRLIS
jgi:hypothetical protein